MSIAMNVAEALPPQPSARQDDAPGLVERRREFERYATSKSAEIDEFRLAHRYYSGDQWTSDQKKTLINRKQPVVTFNRVSRKVDGVIGTVRRLRTDPKAYPRHQGHEAAAELATQVIRYVCDATDFENIESEALLQAGVIGYAGIELELKQSRQGDPDVGAMVVDSRTFFYDPRSTKWDFSDARFMGTYKWVTPDEVEEIAPGFGDRVRGVEDGTFSTMAETDRDKKWTDELGRVKLVDHWYIEGGRWKWMLHTGQVLIDSGESPFFDEDGRSLCKFRMWSAYVDHEGDRYGFIRNMKGPQDAINQHRSKALHIMNSRQVKARRGSIDPAEIRKEAAKPDGIMVYDGNPDDFEIIQPAQEFLQQTQYFQDAKDEIENFGPNQALLGTEMKSSSGRAIAMMQQSGLAELGPFLKNYRMWKLDVYKAIWGACKQFWQAERWLRVSGDEKVAQFIQVNQSKDKNGFPLMDEYGQPVIINQLGAIDVDISISEGPDTENVMGDTFDLMQSLAQNGVPIPPQAILEVSALPSSIKEKLGQLLQPPPNPMKEQADMALLKQEIEKANKLQAETLKIMSEIMVNKAKAEAMPMEAMAGLGQGQGEQPQPLAYEEQAAKIRETDASTTLKMAQAAKLGVETLLAPEHLAQKAEADKARMAAMNSRQFAA